MEPWVVTTSISVLLGTAIVFFRWQHQKQNPHLYKKPSVGNLSVAKFEGNGLPLPVRKIPMPPTKPPKSRLKLPAFWKIFRKRKTFDDMLVDDLAKAIEKFKVKHQVVKGPIGELTTINNPEEAKKYFSPEIKYIYTPAITKIPEKNIFYIDIGNLSRKYFNTQKIKKMVEDSSRRVKKEWKTDDKDDFDAFFAIKFKKIKLQRQQKK